MNRFLYVQVFAFIYCFQLGGIVPLGFITVFYTGNRVTHQIHMQAYVRVVKNMFNFTGFISGGEAPLAFYRFYFR